MGIVLNLKWVEATKEDFLTLCIMTVVTQYVFELIILLKSKSDFSGTLESRYDYNTRFMSNLACDI